MRVIVTRTTVVMESSCVHSSTILAKALQKLTWSHFHAMWIHQKKACIACHIVFKGSMCLLMYKHSQIYMLLFVVSVYTWDKWKARVPQCRGLMWMKLYETAEETMTSPAILYVHWWPQLHLHVAFAQWDPRLTFMSCVYTYYKC